MYWNNDCVLVLVLVLVFLIDYEQHFVSNAIKRNLFYLMFKQITWKSTLIVSSASNNNWSCMSFNVSDFDYFSNIKNYSLEIRRNMQLFYFSFLYHYASNLILLKWLFMWWKWIRSNHSTQLFLQFLMQTKPIASYLSCASYWSWFLDLSS